MADWADDDDNVDVTTELDDYLPEAYEEGPDDKGIKTLVSFRIQDGQKQKVIRKVKVVTKKKKVSKRIQERLAWKKFGLAEDAPPGPEEETTIVSRDDVHIENPGDENKAQKREEDEMIKRLRSGALNRKKREEFAAKESTILGSEGMGQGLRTGTALSQMADAPSSLAAAGGPGGKYVPMHLRGGDAAASMSRFEEEDQTTLRVTNISEDTTEDDLRDLFQPFGRIQRVYLARDRETQISRGFAYISFHYRDDAQRAMDKLNGFGYDHLILKVEWAKPSTRDDAGTQSVMKAGIVSGYGGALPQNMG
ncbi:Eukaryotic translation initiation factor 3 subunit G [Hondaea fermentalgiana]|uniref:Eukaryotic translation initiation factor 3 subunit G n=1 Tax=Hondaea fermentalgiana TaxID=2315210 RepID=A0A2R5GFT7_9STRA|nr:Eukaryotic translation initiation factor 3 subunit G [Hondaea fermentalgiana]|eukprot:GBG29776.1 Eukaryotic translation initiation factor 3 subunit G [Hondaea fermentalgiana]